MNILLVYSNSFFPLLENAAMQTHPLKTTLNFTPLAFTSAIVFEAFPIGIVIVVPAHRHCPPHGGKRNGRHEAEPLLASPTTQRRVYGYVHAVFRVGSPVTVVQP